jgi:hydroxyacylglutathione hydrolase
MTEIFPIKLRISNAYLVKGERNILVDTGSEGEGKRIIKALNINGLDLKDIALIVHTHGHSDHCGSTRELTQIHKIPTAIHSADIQMTEAGNNGNLKTRGFTAKLVKPFVDKPFPAFKADTLMDNLTNLHQFGIQGIIHHTPGHTKGSISIEFDNNEAIIGDLLMGGYFGGAILPQVPDYHYFVDDFETLNLSIKKALLFNANKFYVGHGGAIPKKLIEKRFG